MLKRLLQLIPHAVLTVILLTAVRLQSPTSYAISLHPIVAGGFKQPVQILHAGDDSERLFVVELEGRIRILDQGSILDDPYLDITEKVQCCQEQGLFSMAFDPEFKVNGAFYLNYTARGGDTIIERYVVRDPQSNIADLVQVETVMYIEQPYFNHNGGQLQFGPRDGYLYIGMGDGGGPGDPDRRGQALDTLMGKMLRINVRGVSTYTIPPDNPFVDQEHVRPEIWAIGLRNPWRFSFDRATGDMYIGDVGAVCFEEIDYEPAGAPGGLNYGWSVMEGFHSFNPDEADLCTQPRIEVDGMVLPITEYSHRLGFAVTGGMVYRGRQYPWLNGIYFYADFFTGRIWSLQQLEPGVWHNEEVLNTDFQISAFGEDRTGELYLVEYENGGVYQLISAGGAVSATE